MADEQVKPVIPGSPEHEAAMAAKAEANIAKALDESSPKPLTEAPPKPLTEAPPKEPEQEAPEEGAKEEAKEEPPKKTPEEGTEGEPEEGDKGEAKEALESVGIDYNALQAEYDKDGALSDESYAKLEKVGFPKDVVDAFIAGQEAIAERTILKGYDAAGGQEQFNQMIQWASTGLTQAEQEAYNTAVNSGSEEQMLQAVRGLRSRYEGEYGRQPRLLGGTPAGDTQQGYASRQEMTAEMRDPRYAKDPAFRAKVAQKIAATTAF